MQRFLQINVCVTLSLLLLLLPPPPVQTVNMENTQSGDVQEFSRRLAVFSMNMYSKLSVLKPNQNVVFSPFSIQSCAAMARLGAEGETAAELDRGLGLISSDAHAIAESFHHVLASYENSSILHIANRIYVMNGYNLRDEFNSLLKEQFLSSAENLDFAQSVQAAATINGWVEKKTNNLIKDLIAPSALDQDSRVVLVNAIHFKGNWVHPFPEHSTFPERFYLSEADGVNVPMMNVKARFRYADLPNLDAKALELPYENSDLVMLVLLPNSKTGLAQLEEKLLSTPLSTITQSMSSQQVLVKLPKFKAEFEIELTDAFKRLGMSRMFSNQAEFGKMLKSPEDLQVSKIVHKAFIEVNEKGTEAAAATAAVVRQKRSLIYQDAPVEFHADHPFIYVLAHKQTVPLFFGSVVHLDAAAIGSCAAPSSDHDEL